MIGKMFQVLSDTDQPHKRIMRGVVQAKVTQRRRNATYFMGRPKKGNT